MTDPARKPRERRWLSVEVVQTSSMDCGPAALKCLLEGYGVPISFGRPQDFDVSYASDGVIRGIRPARRILRRKVDDLETIPYPTAPVVPFTGIVHDRAGKHPR